MPFTWGGLEGRYGELIAIRGPRVTAASILNDGAPESDTCFRLLPGGVRSLSFTSDGVAVSEIKRYTTIERMGGFVQLRPNCGHFKTMKNGAYEVTFEPHNSEVQHLYQSKDAKGEWTGQVVHTGSCLRIHGAVTLKEQGILIHEASNVSWLTGCISPRTFNNYKVSLENKPKTNASYLAMNELFQFIGRDRANFFVLDW